MLLGIAEGESALLIAAVNWSVPGGVDVGYVQRRVSGPPFDDKTVRRAFDSFYQFTLVKRSLLALHEVFLARPAVHTSRRAFELATLNHNYPSGADRLSRTEEKDLTAYWTTPQAWVKNIGVQGVETPLEWTRFYIAKMTRYVTDWS